jgi:hypothetical protein
MSSLFEKLKTLVTARVLGSAPRQSDSAATDEREAKAGPVPEVTDASAQRQDMPEVTEASPTEIAVFDETASLQKTDSTPPKKEGLEKAGADSQIDGSKSDSLEDARVADLLEGKKS